jgi:hypothetical protein
VESKITKSWRLVTSNLRHQLPLWLAALWWGSLTTIGFLVVPLLFVYLPTPAVAGAMAAKLFAAQTWVSVLCGGLVLVLSRKQLNGALSYEHHARAATIFIVAGLLLSLVSEFAIAPRIVARENLRLWHGAGTAVYFLQWLSAAVAFAKLRRSGQIVA